MLHTATSEQAVAIAKLLVASRQAFLPYAPLAHSTVDVTRWVAEELIPTGRLIVWEQEQSVVAVLATSESESCAWIDQLYVLPGYESQGFGSKLLEHAHQSLPRPIRLYTFQQNHGARRFYERHGYKAIALSDGQDNEEKCPDVLYEFGPTAVEA